MDIESKRYRTLRLAAILLAGSVALTGCKAGEAGATFETPKTTMTVEAGDTLSEIAEDTRSEGESISNQIVDIQMENNLSSAQIHVGQELIIPR